MAKLLYNLSRKKTFFIFDPHYIETFETSKKLITSPVLAIYNPRAAYRY